MEFKEFAKIARLNREVVVTEKIDGTNAQVLVIPAVIDATPHDAPEKVLIPDSYEGVRSREPHVIAVVDGLAIFAGSRNRFITPEKDNFGFARWVQDHAEELARLGAGTHYGEWWGSGVQRGYGLVNGEKRFSLFNVGRWYDAHGTNLGPDPENTADKRNLAPACCYVVPILAHLPNFKSVNEVLEDLKRTGSCAAKGFMKPEGVVAFHSASGTLFKATCEKDEKPKGQAA